MVNKEVKFTLTLDDQASAKMQEVRRNMESLSGSATALGAGATGGAGRTTGGVPGGAKGGGRKKAVDPQNQIIPEEWGRPLRAMGAYRTAWFAGQDMSGAPMKAAAGIFILQSMGDTLKKILDTLVQSSPALRAEMKILNVAFNEIMRPMADVVATVLRPIARRLLMTTVKARAELSEEGYTPGTAEYAQQFNDVMLHEFWHMLSGQSAMDKDAVSEIIDDLRTATEIFGENIDRDEYNSQRRLATLKLTNPDQGKESMSEAELDLLRLSYEDYAAKYYPGQSTRQLEEQPEWWESEFWTQFGNGDWWPDDMSVNLNTLSSTVGTINDTLSTFTSALEKVNDAMDVVNNTTRGASDALGVIGDLGRHGENFISGIAGYFK